MKILFNQVRIRNFLSFGNTVTTFNYQAGINIVTGIIDGSVTKNGAGKSTLVVDAISFALYGKPLRGDAHINKEELINKSNGKNCLVEVDFVVDNNKFTVARGIKPNIFTIHHNDEEVKLDSIKNTQDWLISKLGVSHTCFSNIVVLNVNSSVPFLGMDAMSKRKVMEDIVSLNIYGRMGDTLKNQHLDAKSDITIIENDIRSKCKALQVAKEGRERIIAQQESFDKEKALHCDAIREKIESVKQKIISLKSKITDVDYRVSIEANTLTLKDTQVKIGLLSNKRVEVNKNLRDASVNLASLEHVTTCPTCKTTLADSPMAQKFINDCKMIIKESSEMLTNINTKVDQGKSRLQAIEDEIRRLNNEQEAQTTIKSNISNLTSQLKLREEELENENRRVLDLSNTISEERIKEYQDSLDVSEKALIENNKKFAYSKFLRNILGEDGIRKFVLNNIIPHFNNKINHYLKVMGSDYSLIFDTDLTESIISRNRDVRTYSNFSSGEKKRIDLSILLALMDVAKMQNSVDTNLFVLDEVLDTSMDNDGVECFLDYLRNDFKKTYPEKCVYIITHRNDVSGDTFDRMIYLRKVKSFTTIDKIVEFHTKE